MNADKVYIQNKKINGLGIVLFVVGTLLLIKSWYALFWYITAITEGWLAPWDIWQPPPMGTLARSVNDFFETSPGAFIPFTLFILADIGLFIFKTFKCFNRILLPFVFTVLNILFVIADVVLALAAHSLPALWLPEPRPLVDVGYHRTWPAIAVTLVLLVVQFMLKWRLFRERHFIA